VQATRPDGVVRFLTLLVSIAYAGAWVGAVVVLAGAPVVKLLAGGDPDWEWGLPVPVAMADSDAAVLTAWGTARLEVEDVRGVLRLPIATIPWWLFGVLWTHMAAAFALMVALLHHLRRIFQRVRAGAPFDAQNAIRLRWVGLLLIALSLLNGVAELVTSMVVRQGLAGGSVAVAGGLRIEAPFLLVALVLLALAEIFRRGAELEHEQSLVV
jgi:hypothetical protein